MRPAQLKVVRALPAGKGQVEQVRALEPLVGEGLAQLAADVARGRGILKEAMPALIHSFAGLRDDLSAQSLTLISMSERLQGTETTPGFLTQMRNVMQTFVRDLVTVSHASMKLVERVEVLSTDVGQIVQRVTQIETLSRSTRFIALNARIEAHRAGDAGKTFRVVADEVKALADEAAGFSQEIHELVEQTQARLEETRADVSRLASHDLNSVLEAQKGVVDALEQMNATNQQVSSSLQRFKLHVDTSIRAMQFEDILEQLLTSVQRRAEALGELWAELVPALLDDDPERWARVEAATTRARAELTRKSSVAQTSIQAGDAELF